MAEYSTWKLEYLYLKYNKLMFNISYNILNDHQLAQDAVQMSFLKIMENIQKIDEVDCNKTKAFVVIICKNISINIFNNRKHHSALVIDDFSEILPDNTLELDEQMVNLERLSSLREKIKTLYEPYADIITLKYTFNYSDKEISKMLDISEQNVRVRLHRAKISLMRLINADEGADVV